MEIQQKISLKEHNTFRIDVTADHLMVIKTMEEAESLAESPYIKGCRHLITGKGSNLLFISDFRGTIIKSCIDHVRTEHTGKDHVIICAGSGLKWDSLVEWAVSRGLGGLENLSAIPGSVGAAPVQNIGAYGAEAGNVIEKVRAVSMQSGELREFSNSDCRFGYRDSIFKKELKGKYLITDVFFRLETKPVLNLEYGSVRSEAEKMGPLSVQTVREAVVNIRSGKLPDTDVTGNAGSFFKNPVISTDSAEILKVKYPGINLYDDPSGGIKIPAGWLIEQCGWKGKRIGDAGVYGKQALVLINHGNATGMEILEMSEMIKNSVYGKFGIMLEREVEVIE